MGYRNGTKSTRRHINLRFEIPNMQIDIQKTE